MQLCQNSINCVNGKWVIRFRADHHGFMLETHILPFHKWGLTNNMRKLNEWEMETELDTSFADEAHR